MLARGCDPAYGGSVMWRALILFVMLLSAPGAGRAERVFVLVHGAFVGEWYWAPVVAALEAEGHRAIAVSLRGQGARAAEAGPGIALGDHVEDIVARVRAEGVSDIILVAHSYGGRPATGAWDRLRGEVSALVFFEAVAPHGVGEVAIPAAKRALARLMLARPDIADSGLIPVPERVTAAYPGRVLAPQPMRTVFGELRLRGGPLPEVPAVYVLGRQSRARIFREYAARVQALRGWQLEEIESGHDVVRDAPDEVVRILLGMVTRPAQTQ